MSCNCFVRLDRGRLVNPKSDGKDPSTSGRFYRWSRVKKVWITVGSAVERGKSVDEKCKESEGKGRSVESVDTSNESDRSYLRYFFLYERGGPLNSMAWALARHDKIRKEGMST